MTKMSQAMQTLTSSTTNQWYTPPYIIALVYDVLGAIDLDPASHAIPQHWIQASRFYTKREDGLSRKWHGCIFLNPPYSKIGNRSGQGVWAAKLMKEYASGRGDAAILLTRSVPGYIWWDDLFSGLWPGPMCITYGRVPFVKPSDVVITDGAYNLAAYRKNKMKRRSKVASSFWYCGPYTQRFTDVFSEIGRVLPRAT